MADWYGAARTNSVKIKDMEGLKKSLEPFPTIEIYPRANDKDLVAFMVSRDYDYGGWPGFGSIENEDGSENEIEFSFSELVVPFMAEGEVLIAQEIGHEKLRYVTGYAEAYSWDGRHCAININDIMDKAAKEFGVDRATISDPAC